MIQVTQKDAVYAAVISVTGFNGEGQCTPSRDQRKDIAAILFEGFKSGHIQLDREFSDTELNTYISGLMSNWLRKDTRLNGGVKYVAKNPGSRQGSGDEQLKALRALMSSLTDEADKAEVQAHIDARVAELARESAPKIDFSKLPAALQAKFQK